MLDRRRKELELVEVRYGELEVGSDLSWVVIRRLSLPAGWNKAETSVLILLPPGYPETPPDYFYADSELLLASGAEPGYSSLVDHAECRWRQFSWHFEDTNEWQPHADAESGHNLLTFMLGVEQRLAEAN